MRISELPPGSFSVGQARHIVKDLFTPKPWVYWTDFLLSMGIGGACFGLHRRVLEPWTLAWALAFVVCGICYFRAVLFTHELVHIRDNKKFNSLRVAWNLMCGIPFLMPTFTYYTHLEHHQRKHFGTHGDGEYIPLARMSPIHIFIYMLQPLWMPLAAVLRFAILSPISWISPRFRQWVHRHMSSMIMDPTYIRPLPSRETLRVFRLQEALCFAWCVGVVAVIGLGLVPYTFLLTGYCLAVFILTLNNFRTLGAHRYTNQGGEITFLDQMLDSVNYPNWPLLGELWMPVGLRYHGLHHVFPSLPYHNLGIAHQRLMAELPADSPYRQTVSPGLLAAIGQLWRSARKSARTERLRRERRTNAGRRHTHAADQALSGAR
jgi:fatty acid desaturase